MSKLTSQRWASNKYSEAKVSAAFDGRISQLEGLTGAGVPPNIRLT